MRNLRKEKKKLYVARKLEPVKVLDSSDSEVEDSLVGGNFFDNTSGNAADGGTFEVNYSGDNFDGNSFSNWKFYDGIETGEYYSVYDNPKILFLNIKPITDVAERNAFGEDVGRVLKAVYTPFDAKNIEISEFDAVWIANEPNGNLSDGDLKNPMNNDYFVFKKLDTGNQICVYFKKNIGALNEN